MAEKFALNDYHSSIDKDKQDNIGYLFDTNSLHMDKLLDTHHRKLHNDDTNKQSKREQIPVDHLHKQQKINDPEQMLHSKVIQHNTIKKRHNYIHGARDENARTESRSFLLVLITVVLLQVLIYHWRKKHIKSFFIFTLLGLWLFPIILSIQLRYYRMICIWSIFSIIFGLLLHMSRQRPMNRKTPRFLYSWFYFLYKLTNILSIVGYLLFLFDFFGLGILIFGPHPKEEREYRNKLLHHQHEAHLHSLHHDINLESVKEEMLAEKNELNELQHGYSHLHFSDIGIYLLFYGLYYGVLARDTAKLCTNWISSALGFFNPSGFPRRRVPANVCAVCNNPLIDHNIGLFDADNDNDNGLTSNDNDSTTDRRMKLMKQRRRMDDKFNSAINSQKNGPGFPWNLCNFNNTKQDEELQLNCKHRFHGFCIRGWIMIGKRDVCPVCKEKVNLKGIFANPWQKQDRMWSQLLDGVRYLMVWNPVIVLAANLVYSASGLSFLKNKPTHPTITPI